MWMVLIYQLLYLQYHIKWHVAMDDGIAGDDWQVVIAVHDTHKMFATEEQIPVKHRVGCTQRQFVTFEVFHIRLHILDVEDGVMLLVFDVAGIIHHQHTAVHWWWRLRQLVQADSGRDVDAFGLGFFRQLLEHVEIGGSCAPAPVAVDLYLAHAEDVASGCGVTNCTVALGSTSPWGVVTTSK